MPISGREVYKSTLWQEIESLPRLQSVLGDFWSNLFPRNRYALKVLDPHLYIIVHHIAENRPVLHQTHMSSSDATGVARCGDEHIPYLGSLRHRHDGQATHSRH